MNEANRNPLGRLKVLSKNEYHFFLYLDQKKVIK
jgi:hypothetical protein